MDAAFVFGAIAAIGAVIGRILIWAAGMRGALMTGLAFSVLGAVLAGRQWIKAQNAPDGWTGIAEALGAAFIILALVGYWIVLGVVALMRRRK